MKDENSIKISFSGKLKNEIDSISFEEIKKIIEEKLDLDDSIDVEYVYKKDKQFNFKEIICECPMEKIEKTFSNFHKNSTKSISLSVDGKDYDIKLKAQKYRVFKENMKCVVCGLEISKVFLESHPPDALTLSFYGVDKDNLVLFTKDHIHPKSLGGKDHFSNYQTMCCTCNSIKSNYNLNLTDIKKLRNKFEDNSSIKKRAMDKDFLDLRKKLSKPFVPLKYKNLKNYDVLTILDLHIFQNEDDQLEADYFSFVPNSVGCVKRNVPLKVLAEFKTESGIKLVCGIKEESDDVLIVKKYHVKRIRKNHEH